MLQKLMSEAGFTGRTGRVSSDRLPSTAPPSLCPFLFFQVVELMTGGAQTPVTNANKIFYLNLLAQYRLASQVKEEVEHFLKGESPSTLGLEKKTLYPWYGYGFNSATLFQA